MRAFTPFFFLILAMGVYAQQDTIIVTDYTKVMVATGSDGEVFPITNLEDTNQAGFFMNDRQSGKIRICHPEELFVWVNGKLMDVLSECKFYDPDQFYSKSDSDTIFISLSSSKSLADLQCELVIFEALLVIKDEISIPREIRSEFKEFTIISLLAMLAILGLIGNLYPSRISYLARRTFTFKISSYEFINTNFFSGGSMYIISLFSLILSFIVLYSNGLANVELIPIPKSTGQYLWKWVQLAVLVFSLVIIKWILIALVAQLFNFKGLKNFQLFDFINFNLVLLLPALLFITVDFIINSSSQTWIPEGFLVQFPIILILFVIWFTLKFVNNSPHKKLIIISYLCATEIIPAIVLLGLFYK